MLRLRFVFLLLAAASAISAQTGNQLPRVTLKKMVKVFINTQYAAKTKIDTREYLLVMDTSSCNTITASEECVGGSCVCPNVRRFHSHNFKLLSPKAEEVTFFDTGRAVGKAVEVPMSIDELTSPKQGVVVADELSQEVCILSADGVVGMAPPGCSNHFNLETVFGNFVKQGQIAPIFSVHHGRYPDGEHFGEVVFGGSDRKYMVGELTYVPLVENNSWKFKLDGVRIGDRSIAGGNTQALIDTSKSIIVGPEAQISNINKAIGCTPVQKSGLNICEIDCNKIESLPDLVFTIGGKNCNVSAEYYIQQNGKLCYSGLQPSNIDHYQIGDYFIDHYYIEFNWDKKMIGVVESRD
mgnify:CR=1 FL=1